MLTLTSSLALLALDESSGRPYGFAGTGLPHALAATIIVDLLDGGFVEMDDQERLTARPGRPGSPLLAAAWESIRDDHQARPVRVWVVEPTRLVGGLPGVAYGQLVTDGTLEGDVSSGILHRAWYREGDPHQAAELLVELGRTLDGDQPAGADDVVLLSLLEVCRLVPTLFPERDAQATEVRIGHLVAEAGSGPHIGSGVEQAVTRDVAAAVVAGAVATAVAGGAS